MNPRWASRQFRFSPRAKKRTRRPGRYTACRFVRQLRVASQSSVRRNMEAMQGTNNQFATVADRWTGEGTSNSVPRATVGDPNANNRFSDRWVENANHLRIQNIQVGYTLSPEVVQNIGKGFIQSVRLYISLNNLATFTNYSGLDPEVTRGFSFQNGETPLANGQDDGLTPPPRIFQFGGRIPF